MRNLNLSRNVGAEFELRSGFKINVTCDSENPVETFTNKNLFGK